VKLQALNNKPTVLIVPGLRDHVEEHWQTWLAKQLPNVRLVEPIGRDDLSCARRLTAIEEAISWVEGPVIIVAHSGGCITVAHWSQSSDQVHRVCGALLATPPDFESAMPAGYPTLDAMIAEGWLPVPRQPLPFRSLVATSDNDPLAERDRVMRLAKDWGSETVELGPVGHLNPASGFGPWPMAIFLINHMLDWTAMSLKG
jgi:predicted alpha/beta hydrolase family esterase